MHGEERFRAVLIGAVALLLAAPATAAAAGGQSQPSAYKVTSAELDVIENATLTAYSGVHWDGNGRHTDSLQAESEENLPPLPQTLFAGRKNSVLVFSELVRAGGETLVDAEGSTVECSGSWDERSDSSFAVGIKGGRNPVSTWEIDTGVASGSCGLVYNLFPSTLKVKGEVMGEIGSERIVLTTKDEKQKREETPQSTLNQMVNWKGKVVLKETRLDLPGR